ncbi:Nramp family divalent metal transporter [Tamaricihabitans halophyticus]|uniref:Nramp family divalent metal transporter n=1 Tax=Tamaricihabitans halophyticus TaxID=1262583 RepID=UPI00104A3AC8|nr:Nramp family divalent metal transporter [Tamaricihabitans halophyticus]
MAPVPEGVTGYLRALGPGIVMALAWMSAGDLVASSVSGADYGYALMWALVLSLLARYVFVSAIAKYILCNNNSSSSIMEGFRRLWRPLPLLIGLCAFAIGFGYATYIIKGAGTAFYNLIGRPGDTEWGVFISATALVGITLILLFVRRQYSTFEFIARVAAVILLGAFGTVVLIQGFDPAAFLAGLTFQVPESTGGFESLLIVAALIGGVGGSTTNLMYNYFLQDKGWLTPRHRKVQLVDLLVGMIVILVINLAIWVTAAETNVSGSVLDDVNDLAALLGNTIGQFGEVLFWLGLFFITFTTFPSYSYGQTKLLMDGAASTFAPRGATATTVATRDFEKRATFRWLQGVFLLVLPLAFSLPVMPSFVELTIIVNSLAAVAAPIIIIAIIVLTTSSKFLQRRYVNRWWETAALIVVGGIGVWASYQAIVGLLG